MRHIILYTALGLFCVSAASGQSSKKAVSEEVYMCKPQKPLSHTWSCIDQNGKEKLYIVKERE
jgi:hypothetical protein